MSIIEKGREFIKEIEEEIRSMSVETTDINWAKLELAIDNASNSFNEVLNNISDEDIDINVSEEDKKIY